MRKPWRWRPLSATAVVVAAAGWLLYAVWQSSHRTGLATYGAFALPVLVLAGGWLRWAWRRAENDWEAGAADGPDLDKVADRLAAAVQAQWEEAAGERGLAGAEPVEVAWARPSLALAGPLAAAVASERFDPLPGLESVGEEQFAGGRISDLYAVYGGLGSGRLVISGPPGSGKSGAAVLLILGAVRHRVRLSAEDRTKVPVPVLVTASNWDPRRQPVAGWLRGRLQDTYSMFTGSAGAASAAALIARGKIAVIIDGLDEIAADLQPIAVQAISQQANFRVVVLSRTAEMASAAACQGVLQGAAAVELCAIDPADAASYLERVQVDPPPDGWRDLVERIRADPVSPLSQALDSPLALTLVRDTYRAGDDARDLLAFCRSLEGAPGPAAVEAITDHLLDRVLPAAYSPRPGQPPPDYDLATAQGALASIAALMNQGGTRDLLWWRIPAWIPAIRRRLVTGMVSWLVVGLVSWLVSGVVVGLVAGFWSGLVPGIIAGLVSGLVSGPGGQPRRLGKLRLLKALNLRNLEFGLMAGLGPALIYGLFLGSNSGLVAGLVGGLLVELVVGPVFGFMSVLMDALTDTESTKSLSPIASWHDNLKIHLVVGLVAGLVVGAAFGVWIGYVNGLAAGLVYGPIAGFTVALPGSRLLVTALGSVLVGFRWHVPVHMMEFLDDAHRRNVLRTLGPAYQFRHARLQDRLAKSPDMPQQGSASQVNRRAARQRWKAYQRDRRSRAIGEGVRGLVSAGKVGLGEIRENEVRATKVRAAEIRLGEDRTD